MFIISFIEYFFSFSCCNFFVSIFIYFKKQLTEAEIVTIVNTVGGHLRDLENVLDSLLRGDGFVVYFNLLLFAHITCLLY